MPEANDDSNTLNRDEAGTADFEAMSDDGEGADAEDEGVREEEATPAGPGAIQRSLTWFFRWHPYLFLGMSFVLAIIAWSVYPESAAQQIPSADAFYYDGLDRLYRVINPDLPLVADSPADEALAARNAFLNLLVFHRERLGEHPEYINPHLLLGEANRILAEFNPALASKYFADANEAYKDAVLWENAEDGPASHPDYILYNFLDRRERDSEQGKGFLEHFADEIVLRRDRRREYIRFRQAESDLNLGRPELARSVLEDIQRQVDGKRRQELRRTVAEEIGRADVPQRVFELGPDEYRQLDLLLARVYDDLGLLEQARAGYLRYLSAVPDGRSHAFVVGRLADLSLEDGEVYRRVDSERAAEAYQEAARYYRELARSPSATVDDYYEAVLGQARANSRLAELVVVDEVAGIDELAALGRTAWGWLEGFSGQPLPRRTRNIPLAVGNLLATPEMMVGGVFAIPEAAGGTLTALAGGLVVTPHEQKRRYLLEALTNFDNIAEMRKGTEAGERAAVMAATETWNLGLKDETEARLERLVDPLSSPDLILAARLGLARVALDRRDLDRAHMLILGGYYHPQPLWLIMNDADWRKIAARLGNPASRAEPGVWRRVWDTLSPEGREIAEYAASGRRLDDEYVRRFLRALNTMLRRRDFYQQESFPPENRNRYITYLLDLDGDLLTPEDVVWLNRLLLEEAWQYDLSQKGAKDNIGYEPMPDIREILPAGLLDADDVGNTLVNLARSWTRAVGETSSRPERIRMLMKSTEAYRAALERYRVEPGQILYELAANYETLAEIREAQGDHQAALVLTTRAGQSYLDVSLLARGSPREMESLLAAGDAFFRAGRLEWTVESQLRFLERFGYSALPGSESAMAVVRAENLLGRAYWFLNDTENALEAFRRNIPRRTPDRFKSIYYLGRIFLEEGIFKDDENLLGTPDHPLPELDRNDDPIIESALQAFNHIRQSQGINPTARAWRWSTFDLAKLHYVFAERARRAAHDAARPDATGGDEGAETWLGMYDRARMQLIEALERYPLRRNGETGISVRVEPEDYADVMASRFETEYMLVNTLLVLAEARRDEALLTLARAHLENLRDRGRYADALFDTTLDRFQLNAAVIREEVEGGSWDRTMPLPRVRLGDDEGPTHNPEKLRNTLANAMQLLANEYFQAGERVAGRRSGDSGQTEEALASEAEGYYRSAYRTYQDFYDRFGMDYGPQCMVGMGDCLNRLGHRDDAANHYRMARNMAELLPTDSRSDGLLDIGPAFWGGVAGERLRDMEGGYVVP